MHDGEVLGKESLILTQHQVYTTMVLGLTVELRVCCVLHYTFFLDLIT